jgi:hypothetical protein
MKKALLLVVCCAALCRVNHVMAQVPKEIPATVPAKVNAGGLLTQFTNAIKPTSFIDSWAGQKGDFLSKAGNVTQAAGLAKGISSLAGFIKPSMFKQGFNLKSLLDAANTAKTMTQATGLLKNLEGGLKPEAMASGWAGKRSSWLSALDLLK